MGDSIDEIMESPWVQSTAVGGMAAPSDNGMVSYTCRGLHAGAYYCFEIRSISSQGLSEPSPPSEIFHAPPSIPTACRGLLARQVGSKDICVEGYKCTAPSGTRTL